MNFISGLKKSTLCIIICIVSAFIIAAVSWMVKFPGVRRVFMFQSSDSGKICMEARYLPVRPVQGRIRMYVDEALLGPETEHCRPLFSPGTKAVSCFVRKGVLYVNLSEDVLQENGGASSIKEGTKLFRKNILHNFEQIHTVEVFVGGKQAYADD